MTQEGCERACSPSGPVRPGSCPPPSAFPDKSCTQFCSSDDSCPGAQRCCETSCGRQCHLPAGEHPGTCPKMPVLQTFVPCNHTCTDDQQCPPEEKCCYNGCGRSCLPPERHSQCQLPAEPGPCQVLQPRYFYSPNHGRCRVFFYGGCQGNANNFRSRSECHRVCGRNQPGPGLAAPFGCKMGFLQEDGHIAGVAGPCLP
ncbi:Eppin, partial [Ophiophagus hannah]